MTNTNNKKSICFAYFADGKFIGWYGGTFGPVSKVPKIYDDSFKQLEIIKGNLTHKLSKINSSTFDNEKLKVKGLAALGLATYSGEELLRGKDVELRLVECPEYDGPNPNFDKVAYDAAIKTHYEKFDKESAHLPKGFCVERTEFVIKFNKNNPKPECNNWIYAIF